MSVCKDCGYDTRVPLCASCVCRKLTARDAEIKHVEERIRILELAVHVAAGLIGEQVERDLYYQWLDLSKQAESLRVQEFPQ